MSVLSLDPSTLIPGAQPRSQEDFERNTQSLRASISATGQLDPIHVVKEGTRYRIVAGHSRAAACALLGLKVLAVEVGKDAIDAMAASDIRDTVRAAPDRGAKYTDALAKAVLAMKESVPDLMERYAAVAKVYGLAEENVQRRCRARATLRKAAKWDAALSENWTWSRIEKEVAPLRAQEADAKVGTKDAKGRERKGQKRAPLSNAVPPPALERTKDEPAVRPPVTVSLDDIPVLRGKRIGGCSDGRDVVQVYVRKALNGKPVRVEWTD